MVQFIDMLYIYKEYIMTLEEITFELELAGLSREHQMILIQKFLIKS